MIPPLSDQVQRCIDLGLHELAGVTAERLREVGTDGREGVLVVPGLAASDLTPLLERKGKSGFVVVDMPDVDEFDVIEQVSLPSTPYLLADPSRGDHLANWSPTDALPAILEDGRTPMTLSEGIQWLLQQPEVLERNHCFMTIGSRKRQGRPENSTRGHRRSGSATAPAGTAATTGRLPRSAGAGPGTGTPGSGSPRQPAACPRVDSWWPLSGKQARGSPPT